MRPFRRDVSGGKGLSGRMAAVAWLVVMAMPAAASGQVLAGAKIGAGVTNVYGDDVGSGGLRTGLLGGLWLRLPVVGGLGLQVEALLAQKGFSDSADEASVGLRLNYLDVPVLLQLATRGGDSWSALFTLGGAVGFKRGCTASFSAGGVSASTDCSVLERDGGFDIESRDASVIFGTGFRVDRARWVTTVELRGQVGLKEALGVFDPATVNNLEARNGSLSLILGLGVPLGGGPARDRGLQEGTVR